MKLGKYLLIIIFGTILLVPSLAEVTGWGNKVKLEENRELAFKPLFKISEQYPKRFTDYFNDHFGLRNSLIVADRWLRYTLFKVSPNKAITVGKDNWLFYTPDVNYIDTVNAQGFSQTDLEQIKTNLDEIQKKFTAEGIKFYFLAAPNKQSIYPEFLPNYMKKVKPDSRLDQISNYLAGDKEIAFINPTAELVAAKKTTPVYLKYDTHWNEMGAFVAYQKLMTRINQDVKTVAPKTIDEFNLAQKTAPNNDLALQMGVPGSFSETETVFEAKSHNSKIVFEDCPKEFTGCPLTIRETVNPHLPKLVMFRDSFGAGLIPFMSEHFKRAYYSWGSMPYSMGTVEKEKPDVVVMEITERELWRLTGKIFEF